MKLALTALIVALALSPAHAADIFTDNDGQDIYIVGFIVEGDFERFEAKLDKKAVRNVYTYSPGGSLVDSVNIGDLIAPLNVNTWAPRFETNARLTTKTPGLETRICNAKTRYNPRTGKGNADCDCASGCFLIWAAGRVRLGDAVMVHAPTISDEAIIELYDKGKEDPNHYWKTAEKLWWMAQHTGDYLHRLKVPKPIIERMKKATDPSALTRDELDSMRTRRPFFVSAKEQARLKKD